MIETVGSSFFTLAAAAEEEEYWDTGVVCPAL
jgi:hypothetical protein